MSALTAILTFLLAISILVTIHEYGHYWVAKKVGVKIRRFSVGMGKPIFTRRFGADQTEFVIASLPIGGYVRMVDEREDEQIDPADLPRAFNRKPLGARTAIVLAGPLINLLFAIAVYTVVYLLGVPGVKPVLGDIPAGTPAAQANLHSGQTITAVNDVPTPTWTVFIETAMSAVLDQKDLQLTLLQDGQTTQATLPASGLSVDDISQGELFTKLGLQQFIPDYQPLVESTLPDSVAARAGLQGGDVITGVDGLKLRNADQLVKYISERAQQTVELTLLRGGAELKVRATPQADSANGKIVGRLGVKLAIPESAKPAFQALAAVERYPLAGAFARAVKQSYFMSKATLQVLGKMVTGEASLKNIGGPVTIAQYTSQSWTLGLVHFLSALAVISISLFVLNMLPIPLLDGGHLLFYFAEFVTRKSVPDHIQLAGQKVGLVLLALLMVVAFYNDVMRLSG